MTSEEFWALPEEKRQAYVKQIEYEEWERKYLARLALKNHGTPLPR